MNCFVVMPFSQDFDDVYVTVKASVTNATSVNRRCFRLDEAQPAGRITERLLKELRSATLVVADITGNRPNVMWELGFAMALGHGSHNMLGAPKDLQDLLSSSKHRSTHLREHGGAMRTIQRRHPYRRTKKAFGLHGSVLVWANFRTGHPRFIKDANVRGLSNLLRKEVKLGV
jgi:nucleoside 2-deoxyribosyltransferase